MNTLKTLAKQLPVIRPLVEERDQLLTEKNQLRREYLQLSIDYQQIFAKTIDYFLALSKGIIHIGANEGQERHQYAKYQLPVIWIEPIDEVCTKLEANLREVHNQRALRYLLTDLDDKEYEFHISNNAGLSSSILDLAGHKEIWPEVRYATTRTLRSTTLSTLFKRELIDTNSYDTLVMDTQGSELLVLKGAGNLLYQFKYVKTEAADFEAYTDCCTVNDLKEYLKQFGFVESMRRRFAGQLGVGDYYDVVFERVAVPTILNFSAAQHHAQPPTP
ncbi:MAG: FkbM family methyltransferase [Betaproteobacteria bacterium]|nr:FkbM family methyltransferase [Betaproteobacteria bacterium]